MRPWLANKLIQKMIRSALLRMKVEKHAVNLLLRSARFEICIFAFLTIADQLQINIKSLLAGVGVMVLVLFFATQDTVGNIISGIVIIIDQSFKEDISKARKALLETMDNDTRILSRDKNTRLKSSPFFNIFHRKFPIC